MQESSLLCVINNWRDPKREDDKDLHQDQEHKAESNPGSATSE